MVVVDDHAMFRTGVKAEIGSAVQVVGEAADAGSAIAIVLSHRNGRGAPWMCIYPAVAASKVMRKVHEQNATRVLACPSRMQPMMWIGLIRAGLAAT